MVRQIDLRFQIALFVDVDVEGALEEGEHLLLDCGDVFITAVQLVGGSPREELLPDEQQFVALRVLKRELVAEDEDLTIDEEGIFALSLRMANLSASEKAFCFMR